MKILRTYSKTNLRPNIVPRKKLYVGAIVVVSI
jgi:hypothetical protein